MHNVPDHAIVSHNSGKDVRRMQHRTILNGRAFTNDDLAVIAAQDGSRPD